MIESLRERITFYEAVEGAPDLIGGTSTTKIAQKTTWASVTEEQGDRAQEQQSVYNRQPLTIEFRTDSYAISPNSLIEYEGKQVTIHSIQTDPLKRLTTVYGWLSL